MISELHEVVLEVDTITDSVMEASSMVIVFEALSRPIARMVKGCLIYLMVLSPLEFLHSFLIYPLSSFMSIRKPLSP